MRLDLLAAQEEPLGWDELLELEKDELRAAGVRLEGGVQCRGTVMFTSPDYVLNGDLVYRQRLQCFRCMSDYDEEIETSFQLVVQVSSDVAMGDEVELEESDLDVVLVSEPLLETHPIVAEQVQLQLPMKPLCRTNCKGLCPGCGADLNDRTCDCEARSDSPFAGLADLKRRLSEQEES